MAACFWWPADKNDSLLVVEAATAQVLTIFGASGDLTKRKLIPALYNFGYFAAGRVPGDSLRQEVHSNP
jgi:hypothetical protein